LETAILISTLRFRTWVADSNEKKHRKHVAEYEGKIVPKGILYPLTMVNEKTRKQIYHAFIFCI
jgi:disulfide oxidoreductase YuzD